MPWPRLFEYRNMVNDTVRDSVMYIHKSRDPDPEYWSEELLKIMEKAESDSQLSPAERQDIINLIEKANDQLNIKLTTIVKTGGENEHDYTRLDKHLSLEEPTEEEVGPQVPQPKVFTKDQKPLGPLASFPPPQPVQPPVQALQHQGKILGDLTKGGPISTPMRMVDGLPIEQFIIDKNKSKFKQLRT